MKNKNRENPNCQNCGKLIPNCRSARAKTCTNKCSMDWNHSSVKKREERKIKYGIK